LRAGRHAGIDPGLSDLVEALDLGTESKDLGVVARGERRQRYNARQVRGYKRSERGAAEWLGCGHSSAGSRNESFGMVRFPWLFVFVSDSRIIADKRMSTSIS